MKVLIYHNTTTWADLAADGNEEAKADLARDPGYAHGLAIFRRMPPEHVAPIEPGDRLKYIGTLDLELDIAPGTDALAVAEYAGHAAYAAGNSPYEGDQGVTTYRTWNVRSLSIGDVIVAGGKALAVADYGFTEIDATLAPYRVEGKPLAYEPQTQTRNGFEGVNC